MRSKVISAILLVLISALFCGCKTTTKSSCEVALITDGGTVTDGEINEGCFAGIQKYCDENGIKYNHYVPEMEMLTSFLAQVDNAVKDGAKVVICPSYMLEETVYEAAKKYPKVDFVLVDGLPHNSVYSDYTISENVLPITFAEEEAGFLAGYAAVRDGYDRLGFLGGMAEDAVIRYGYGFVQGADYAGIEIGKKIYIAYTYTNKFSENKQVLDMARVFYDYSVQAIFTCAGASGNSVMHAAEEKDGAVIGADYDHSFESPTVVFSCVKNYEKAVYDALTDYYSGNFVGGSERRLTASEEGVKLAMDTGKYREFSDIEYNAIYEELAKKDIVPYGNTDIGTTAELNLVNTEIIYQ